MLLTYEKVIKKMVARWCRNIMPKSSRKEKQNTVGKCSATLCFFSTPSIYSLSQNMGRISRTIASVYFVVKIQLLPLWDFPFMGVGGDIQVTMENGFNTVVSQITRGGITTEF